MSYWHLADFRDAAAAGTPADATGSPKACPGTCASYLGAAQGSSGWGQGGLLWRSPAGEEGGLAGFAATPALWPSQGPAAYQERPG
jgi:hypothetical protein